MKKVIAVLTFAAMLIAFSACSKAAYNDKVVTAVVTDENGETVTDAQGEPVTEIVSDTTDGSQADKTDKTDQAGETSGSGAAAESTGKDKGGKTTAKKGKTTTKKDKTTEKKDQSTTKSTTTTTVPANRKITVQVELPNYNNMEDTLTIYVNDKKVKSAKVNLNGSAYTFTTKDKYKGKVKVTAALKTYDKTASSGSVQLAKDKDTAVINLMNMEILDGRDD